LPPAFRTGQRVIKLREQLAVLLQDEYDQLVKTAAINPGTEGLMKSLESQIDAVKPASLDKARAEKVRAELDGRSKDELQRELKVLRNAINAWTAYELVKAGITQKLTELAFDDETLRNKLRDKKAELAQQVADQEAKEADYQEGLMEVLYHVADTRHAYAKAQSSTTEKRKALRAAERDAAALTQRVPREAISGEWWGKFNATYKGIRRDLKPLAEDGEVVDTTQDLPVPVQVSANLTWLERPSNTAAVAQGMDGGTDGTEEAEPPKTLNMTWVILAVLFALGGTGAAVYFMMGTQKKKPFRVNYGSGPMAGGDEKITFPGEGLGEPAPQRPSPPRPVKKTAAAATATKPRSPGATSGDAPRKAAPKKRPPAAAGEPPKPRPKPRPPE
jgi:hypothetical protein